MKVAVLQSSYIPWKGYFDIIHDVDLFIFYDDVQYTRADWRNRNRVKGRQGSGWLTIPVHGGRDSLLHEVTFADDRWRQRHWKTLSLTYGRAPFFHYYKETFESEYLDDSLPTLSQVNQRLITKIATDILGVKTRFADSRTFGAVGFKLDRMLDLLSKCGATSYLSGPAAKTYIDEARFAQAGIELQWKDYSGYPEYSQLSQPFEHGVSILDLLFNVGTAAPDYIWGWRGPS